MVSPTSANRSSLNTLESRPVEASGFSSKMEELMDFLDLAPLAIIFRREVLLPSGGWLFDVTQFLCNITGLWDFYILIFLFVISHLVFRSVDPGAAFFLGFGYDFDIPLQCYINKHSYPIHVEHLREYWPIFGVVTALELLCLSILDEDQFGILVTVKSTAMTALWLAKKDGEFLTSYLVQNWSQGSVATGAQRGGGYNYQGGRGGGGIIGNGRGQGIDGVAGGTRNNPNGILEANPTTTVPPVIPPVAGAGVIPPPVAPADPDRTIADVGEPVLWIPDALTMKGWGEKLKAAGYDSSPGRKAMIIRLKRCTTPAEAADKLQRWLDAPDNQKTDIMRELLDGKPYRLFSRDENLKDSEKLREEYAIRKYKKPPKKEDAFVVPNPAERDALKLRSATIKQAKDDLKEQAKTARDELKEQARERDDEARRFDDEARRDKREQKAADQLASREARNARYAKPMGWFAGFSKRRREASIPEDIDKVIEFLRYRKVRHDIAAQMIVGLFELEDQKAVQREVAKWMACKKEDDIIKISDKYDHIEVACNNDWWYENESFSLKDLLHFAAVKLDFNTGTRMTILKYLMSVDKKEDFDQMQSDLASSEKHAVWELEEFLTNVTIMGGVYSLSLAKRERLMVEMERLTREGNKRFKTEKKRWRELEDFKRLKSDAAVQKLAEGRFGKEFSEQIMVPIDMTRPEDEVDHRDETVEVEEPPSEEENDGTETAQTPTV